MYSIPTIAILWQRMGPYHRARIQGASSVFESRGWRCVGIEVSRRDHYAWSQLDQEKTTTLFDNRAYESLSRAQIRSAVTACLDELQPAAIAVNGWSVPEALAATAWCHRNARPSVLMSETHQPSGRFWKEWVKARRIARADAALVGGRWHADYLVSLGFPRDRVFLGYDAVDNDFFRQGAERARSCEAAARRGLELPDHYFYANTRFLPRKNIDGLLHAYARYRERLLRAHTASRSANASAVTASGPGDPPAASPPVWELVVTGGGVMEADWKRLAESLGIHSSVHWPGFVQYDDLPRYYGLASAFVHPARREAWGVVVNEAAAAGLPLIVGSRVGSVCELVEHGENGYVVDAEQNEQLASAMLRLATLDPSERQAMGARSRALVSRFDANNFGQSLWAALSKAGKSRVEGREPRAGEGLGVSPVSQQH